MKKFVFLFALLIQTAFVFASHDQATMIARANTDNVKMYRQAGTSTEIVRSLKSTDDLVVVRKHNANWSIVTIDGEVGYVLTSELYQPREVKNIALAKPVRK